MSTDNNNQKPHLERIYENILRSGYNADELRELGHRLTTQAHRMERNARRHELDSFRKEMMEGFRGLNESSKVAELHFEKVENILINGDYIGGPTAPEKSIKELERYVNEEGKERKEE